MSGRLLGASMSHGIVDDPMASQAVSGSDEVRAARLYDGVVTALSAPIPLRPLLITPAVRDRSSGIDARRRLFGHPLARVFIVGNRLLVVHPQGGAA